MSRNDEINFKKLLDGAPKPLESRESDGVYLLCPNKRFISDAKPGEPYEEYCEFRARKNLSGYEKYKEHWHKEHSKEKVLRVKKIKSQYYEGYVLRIDLAMKGGELLDNLIHLEIHNFSKDFSNPWNINIYRVGDVNIESCGLTLPIEPIHSHLRAIGKNGSISENAAEKAGASMKNEITCYTNSMENKKPSLNKIKDLIQKIKAGQQFDTRATDSISQAEEWQKEGYRVECIAFGKIIMKIELEKILFAEKVSQDKEFRKKVLEDHCYSQSDLYKIPEGLDT